MLAQVLAIIIFLAMFLLIILEIWERQWITLACGLLTLLLVFGLGMHSMGAIMRTLNLQSFFTTGFWYAAGESSEASSGINWQTIIFIAGMMIMVEGMAKVGFFRWLCMEIAKMVKYQVIPIFMTFMLLSFVLAMFIDSITVILFLAAVTIELSQLLEFDPVPMILSEIFSARSISCSDMMTVIPFSFAICRRIGMRSFSRSIAIASGKAPTPGSKTPSDSYSACGSWVI